eukprot:gene19029-biopygen22008
MGIPPALPGSVTHSINFEFDRKGCKELQKTRVCPRTQKQLSFCHSLAALAHVHTVAETARSPDVERAGAEGTGGLGLCALPLDEPHQRGSGHPPQKDDHPRARLKRHDPGGNFDRCRRCARREARARLNKI